MFHKYCIFMLFVGLVSVAGAAERVPQIITSEVFDEVEDKYVPEKTPIASEPVFEEVTQVEEVPVVNAGVPVWPVAGSEADVEIACGELGCNKDKRGLVIENNIVTDGTGWTGGPNISNGIQVPAGFDYECANNAEMPLMRREMMEDDGGSVLAMSRSSRKNCNKSSDSYAVFAQRAGFEAEIATKANGDEVNTLSNPNNSIKPETEVAVNEYVDEEAPAQVQDQVRSWVVANGQTLRQVLQSWCDKEGWDLVWTTSREYPIEASAVFKGRFIDVASALVRNFERATPIPYAKFYKGNRVLVISTTEE